ncbi:hypothetical protein [Flammeovirga sp. SJP92]|uniref:hypothetical protein n=1 Tax=Flammeovirga sp. SJP92 TaxID=1775430 RepID=UPI000788C2F9|nr:hypothetical protein [Flammeovirga sp. SJP92]KXX72040.1 hypothetical protein AVL50_02640 [Flammeovirga sp. SJP92]
MKYTLLIIALLSICHSSFSQKKRKKNKSAIEYDAFISSKDRRIRTSVSLDKKTGEIKLFVFPENAFDQFFPYGDDGVSIDIVQRRQYDCSKPKRTQVDRRPNYKGNFFKTIYRNELLKNKKVRSNMAIISLGYLPSKYRIRDVEVNYFVIRGGVEHDYNWNYNIKQEKLSAFDLPLIYFKPPKSNSILHQAIQNSEIEYSFSFKKNETQFDSLEYNRLYTYFQLNDYKITSFYIKAFSSIEGDTERNANLSYLRAENIINELSHLMAKDVKSFIETGENWDQFYKDIIGTSNEHFLQKPKSDIKSIINKEPEKYESILSKQRVATIKVRLEKLVSYESLNEKESYELFGELVSKDQQEEAYLLQSYIIDKVKNGVYSLDSLNNNIQLPKKKKYVMLYQNFLVLHDDISTYRYMYHLIDSYRKLLEIAPQNPTLIYNLSALLAKNIQYNRNRDHEKEVEQNIAYLQSRGFKKVLLDKLILNRLIILAKTSFKEGKFEISDNYNNRIYNFFTQLDLSEEDKIRMAQHLMYFALGDKAIELLSTEVLKKDCSEDLMFYFINLTIIDNQQTRRPYYSELMQKAVKMNRTRFCHLFNSKNDTYEGVTFQLLDQPVLKKTYCEECASQVY